ncbi:MAG: serine/threonine-protein kinase [Polyangiaceae bacterium]
MAEAAPQLQSSREPQRSPLFVGTPYRVVQPIGEGGTAEIYLVEHVQLGSRHAAKVLRQRFASNAQAIDRLRVESQTLSRLNHPHIVTCTDLGLLADGRPYFVMELLEGETLEAALAKRGSLSAFEAVAHAGNILSALAAAHAMGVVHRDLKPSNVFIVNDSGGSLVVKVLDFGVARILPGAPEGAPQPVEVPTADNVLIGTPRYLSPEGALGMPVDQRADLYAVGLLLYTMLTGRGPFNHIPRDTGVLVAHAYETPKAPSSVASVPIPPELDRILLKALAKDPNDRYGTAFEFHADLLPVWSSLNCPPHLRDTGVASVSMLERLGFEIPVQTNAPSRTGMTSLAVFALAFLVFGVLTALGVFGLERGLLR